MSHLIRFATEEEYASYYNSYNYREPHVAVVGDEEDFVIKYQPETREEIGDIIYWDEKNERLVKCNPNKWNTTLGIPVGVVAIPSWVFGSFASSQKTRIVSLGCVDENGSNNIQTMNWGPSGTDTSIYNKTTLPLTTNVIESSIQGASTTGGYYPCDSQMGDSSCYDTNTNYNINASSSTSIATSNMLFPIYESGVNGYLEVNQLLYTQICGFYDINSTPDAKTNTLVGLGNQYYAANSAYKYKQNEYGLQWYLPSIGELALCLSRINIINNSIEIVGGEPLPTLSSFALHTCNEVDANTSLIMHTSSGLISTNYKGVTNAGVLPFATLP